MIAVPAVNSAGSQLTETMTGLPSPMNV